MASNYDFSSLGFDDHSSDMLQDMNNACTKAGAWDWIKTFNEESFMFSSHPMIGEISKHMKYDGHSGASFGWCMRSMEYIAKHGWDSFATEVTKNRKDKKPRDYNAEAEKKKRMDALYAEEMAKRRAEAGKHINCTCTVESDRLADLAMSARRRELDIPCSQAYLDMRREEREKQGLFLWCNCPKTEEASD